MVNSSIVLSAPYRPSWTWIWLTDLVSPNLISSHGALSFELGAQTERMKVPSWNSVASVAITAEAGVASLLWLLADATAPIVRFSPTLGVTGISIAGWSSCSAMIVSNS